MLLDLTTTGGKAPDRDEVVGSGTRPPARAAEVPAGAARGGSRGRRAVVVAMAATDLVRDRRAGLVVARPAGRPHAGPTGPQAAWRRSTPWSASSPATLLPRDRPLWRLVVVHGIEPDRAGLVLIVHHVVADGIGTVAQALRLLTPQLPHRQVGVGAAPGLVAQRPRPPRRVWRSSRRTAVPAPRCPAAPLQPARTAPCRCRCVWSGPPDAGTGHGPTTCCSRRSPAAWPRSCRTPPREVRTAVPLMMRDPATAAEGNVTAAVLLDLPLGRPGLRAGAAARGRARAPASWSRRPGRWRRASSCS